MSIIETIRAEVERLKKKVDNSPLATEQIAGYLLALADMQKALDTLQEQPVCDGLEEEIKRWLKEGEITDTRFADYDDDDIEATARHFAQWQKEQMLREAVEGATLCFGDGTYSVVSCCFDNSEKHHEPGDKVRIVIVKED